MCSCQMWDGDEETCGHVSAGSKTHAERSGYLDW